MCGKRVSGWRWITACRVSSQCMVLCVLLIAFNVCRRAPAAGWAQGGGWLRAGAGKWLQTCRQTAALTCRSHRDVQLFDVLKRQRFLCWFFSQVVLKTNSSLVWSYFSSTVLFGCCLPKAAIWQIILDLVIQLLCKARDNESLGKKLFFFLNKGVISCWKRK